MLTSCWPHVAELARKVAEIKLWKKYESQRQREAVRRDKQIRREEGGGDDDHDDHDDCNGRDDRPR